MLGFLALNVIWQIFTLSLIALGLAIIFGQLKILNMAHGEFVMIGAYAPIITNSLGLPPIFQILVCILVVGVIALIIEYLVIRHLYGRVFDSLLATWGISILIRELIIITFGRSYQPVALPITGSLSIAGVSYPTYRVVVMVVLFVFFALLYLWYKKSRLATQVKAMVDDPILIASYGVNIDKLARYTFVVGGIFAGIAGLILAPTTQIHPYMGLDYLIRSFFALVIGGLGSLEGLVIGSSVMGGVQSTVSIIIDQTTGYLFILIIAIVFIWIRPKGIISEK